MLVEWALQIESCLLVANNKLFDSHVSNNISCVTDAVRCCMQLVWVFDQRSCYQAFTEGCVFLCVLRVTSRQAGGFQIPIFCQVNRSAAGSSTSRAFYLLPAEWPRWSDRRICSLSGMVRSLAISAMSHSSSRVAVLVSRCSVCAAPTGTSPYLFLYHTHHYIAQPFHLRCRWGRRRPSSSDLNLGGNLKEALLVTFRWEIP